MVALRETEYMAIYITAGTANFIQLYGWCQTRQEDQMQVAWDVTCMLRRLSHLSHTRQLAGSLFGVGRSSTTMQMHSARRGHWLLIKRLNR